MAFLIAQLSDIHIGGPAAGSGDRFSMAIDTINAMTRLPDLVLLTGDLTHAGSPEEWNEFKDRLSTLNAPWEAIPGNHDRTIQEIAGHRILDAGPLRFVLLDTSNDTFTADDAAWVETTLASNTAIPTIVAVHQPPFQTGIWWMDCLGLKGAAMLEEVVRRHPQVIMVMSGHLHRPIQSSWGSCALWVGPSTAVSIAIDLDPDHSPAESDEAPTFGLHCYTDYGTIVSHIVPVGAPAKRSAIEDRAPKFIQSLRAMRAAGKGAFG